MAIPLITAIIAAGVIIVRQRIEIVGLRADVYARTETLSELCDVVWAGSIAQDHIVATQVDELRHFSA